MRCWAETTESEHSEGPQSFLKQVIKDQDSRSLVDFSRQMLGAGQRCSSWYSSALEMTRGKDSNQKLSMSCVSPPWLNSRKFIAKDVFVDPKVRDLDVIYFKLSS